MNNIAVSKPEEQISVPWLQLEGESGLWYSRFLLYYLPQGPARTLTQAFVKHLKAEKPELAEEKEAQGHYITAQRTWVEAARKYRWRERAEEFDRHSVMEFQQHVAEARRTLIQNAGEAAKTLVANLKNPRQGVAAAKEILNRAGLPSATIVGHTRVQPYSTDDFIRARAELENWENKIRDEVIEGEARDADPESDGNT